LAQQVIEMYVPTGSAQTSPVGLLDPDKQPSQTNLLMAAAEMHKQGRFDQPAARPPRLHRLKSR
jgi:hypothetical protein